MSQLDIYLFGSPAILIDGEPITVDTRKATALLAYIALKNQPIDRASLIDLLWPTYDEDRARSSLRRTLSVLRKALRQEWLILKDETIALDNKDTLYIDVRVFKQTIQRLQHPMTHADIEALEQVVELYRADFMLGFAIRDSTPFEEWVLTESQKLSHDLLDAFSILVTWHSQHSDYNAVIRVSEKWQAVDPFEEKAIYYLLQAHAHLGNRSRAIQIFEDFEQLLRKELEIQPMPDTQDLYMQLVDGDLPTGLAFRTEVQHQPRKKLPQLLKPFIGRAKELDYLGKQITNANSRLINIVATGGMGKTTLCLRLGDLYGHQFQYGAFYVTLSRTTTSLNLVSEIASALELHFHDRDNYQEQLLAFMGKKHILLIIDNFELYDDDHQLIVDMLDRAVNTTLIVVGQQPLPLQESWRMGIKGLDLPTNDSLADIAASDALQLLSESIRRITWDFDIDASIEELADLCHLLEGMPLAIELAAAQIQTVTDCKLVRDAVQSNLDRLATPYANVNERHRSLAAIFSYSWQHLEPAHQHLMLCLTAFRGTFDEAAVLAITGHAPTALQQVKQLALISEDGNGRYHVPSALLTFLNQQDFSGVSMVISSHSIYYSDLAYGIDLDGPHQLADIIRVDVELPNLLAGFITSAYQAKYAVLDQYLDTLFLYFEVRGRYAEGADVFEDAAEQLMTKQPLPVEAFSAYSRLLARLAVFNRHLGHVQQAIVQLETALGIQENAERWPDLAWTLNQLGVANMVSGNRDAGRNSLEQSLALAEDLADDLLIARACANLGIAAANADDYRAAEAMHRRSQAIYERMGHTRLLSYTLNNLGNVYLGQEKYDRASYHYMKSAQQKESLGDQWGVVCSLMNLGRVELARNTPAESLATFAKCLDISTDIGKTIGIAQAHLYLGQAYQALSILDNALPHLIAAAQHTYQIGNMRQLGQQLLDIAQLMGSDDTPLLVDIWSCIAQDDRFSATMQQYAKQELQAQRISIGNVALADLLDSLSNLQITLPNLP